MKIKNISIQNEGYVYCKSRFCSACDSLSNYSLYSFSSGINKLIGEIDSGNWAISYLLSMYNHRSEDFILFEPPKITINDNMMFLNEFMTFSCYMDELDPLFSNIYSVKELVIQGLYQSNISCSINDIRELFQIDTERFERPLKGVGNEIFKAMAAIGFSHKKEVYCFPWLSNKRFENYHENLVSLLKVLDGLEKTVIIPIGVPNPKTNLFL